MTHWRSFLKADPTGWLLEDENPSIKYLTLREILEKSESASEVKSARRNIMENGVIPKILAKQAPGGYWEKEEDFYVRTKYKGTVWQLIILAELWADRDNPRIKKTCEFILSNPIMKPRSLKPVRLLFLDLFILWRPSGYSSGHPSSGPCTRCTFRSCRPALPFSS